MPGVLRDDQDRRADEISDAEALADQVLVAVQRVLESRGSSLKTLDGSLCTGRVVLAMPTRLDDRRFQLGHREHRPLVDEPALVRGQRPVQVRIWIDVGELETKRGRLEQKALLVLEHRHASQRVASPMLVRLALLT